MPTKTLRQVQVKAMFREPLSSYKVVFNTSSSTALRHVSTSIQSVGAIYRDMINTTVRQSDDWDPCISISNIRNTTFGILPNKAAYDANVSSDDFTIEFEFTVLATEYAEPYKTILFYVSLEVDTETISRATIEFNILTEVLIPKINLTGSLQSSSLPNGGKSSASIFWEAPPNTFVTYTLTVSTRRYAGPGGDGLILQAVRVSPHMGNGIPCMTFLTVWKMPSKQAVIDVISIPNADSETEDNHTIGFEITVMLRPEIAMAFSSHELTANISYFGAESPQTIKFYFNVTDEEYFLTPDTSGFFNMYS
ncbi:uncharacterized protein [Argopecten irradians]|uniref:uncharacterized protein n=1 Tax=Argopecten irradians TaxID=31199 RepID=UPI003718315F